MLNMVGYILSERQNERETVTLGDTHTHIHTTNNKNEIGRAQRLPIYSCIF